MIHVYVGVDLGGTSVRVACSDREGNLLQITESPANPGQGKIFQGYLTDILKNFVQSVDSAKYSIKAMGMGIPAIYHDGQIVADPNIGNLDAAMLINEFARLGIPFYIQNDVKCAAAGELWKGAARGCRDFVYVNMGTGLSVAICAGGLILSGHNNASGEIGYWITEPGSALGYSEGHAPLEEKCSGRWIAEHIAKKLGSGYFEGGVTTKRALEAYAAGDELVKVIIDESITYLKLSVSNICSLINPELVVFGGGMSNALDLFFDEIVDYLNKTVPYPPIVQKTGLDGKAGLYGAIKLAMMAGALNVSQRE